jgi:signal transduction histidine kinase
MCCDRRSWWWLESLNTFDELRRAMLAEQATDLEPTSRLRVLLVEDDVPFAQFLISSLHSIAPAVELSLAKRLTTAVSAIEATSFDAILLDLNLPDSQGLETLHRVTAVAADAAVVVLTAIDDTRLARGALRLGAQDWLIKGEPDPDVVLRALRYAVERKQLSTGLLRAQKLEAVGQLAGNVAHEFNNVLMAIIANAELAETTTEDIVRTGALRHLREAANRGSLLTRQLLGISRPGLGAQPRADVGVVVDAVQNLLRAVLPRHVQLRVVCADTAEVALPPDRLEQVLLNLVLNARDAMPTGGTITIVVNRTSTRSVSDEMQTERSSSQYSRIQIRVRDSGTGMHPDILARVFEPFFTTKHAGSGLGLPISKDLVEQAGGTLRAESVFGTGTTFYIELPIAERSEQSEP